MMKMWNCNPVKGEPHDKKPNCVKRKILSNRMQIEKIKSMTSLHYPHIPIGLNLHILPMCLWTVLQNRFY